MSHDRVRSTVHEACIHQLWQRRRKTHLTSIHLGYRRNLLRSVSCYRRRAIIVFVKLPMTDRKPSHMWFYSKHYSPLSTCHHAILAPPFLLPLSVLPLSPYTFRCSAKEDYLLKMNNCTNIANNAIKQMSSILLNLYHAKNNNTCSANYTWCTQPAASENSSGRKTLGRGRLLPGP